MIDGNSEELVSENGIKNYVDTTSSGGGGGVTDHGALTGLGDDDHTQYLLADGTRSITSNWDVDGNKSLVIDTVNHRIGIGTNTPTRGIKIESTDFHNAGMDLVRNTVGAGCSTIDLIHHRDGAKVENGDYLGALRGLGFDGSSNIITSMIGFIVDGDTGAGDMPSKITFSTAADGSSTSTERMVIKSDGSVGIGDSNPSDELSVTGRGSFTADNDQLKIIDPNNSDKTYSISSDNGGFQINEVGVASRVVLDSSGNMGINELSPAAKLDVNGDVILQNGTSINEFSTDGTLAGNSDDAVPTEKAVKTYVDNNSGVTDHGALTGLSDDDHTQYHNDTRGDARYYTQSQVDSSLDGKADSSHTHTESDITDLSHDAVKIQSRDVDSAAPADGQALAWDSATNKWTPSTVGVTADDSVEWKKQQYFDSVSLTASGTSVAWDLESAQFASLTLSGDYTLSNPTNAPASGRGRYTLIVKQDGTGGHTLAFGSGYKFAGGVAPTITTSGNAVDIITFIYDDVSSAMYGTAQQNFF